MLVRMLVFHMLIYSCECIQGILREYIFFCMVDTINVRDVLYQLIAEFLQMFEIWVWKRFDRYAKASTGLRSTGVANGIWLLNAAIVNVKGIAAREYGVLIKHSIVLFIHDKESNSEKQ